MYRGLTSCTQSGAFFGEVHRQHYATCNSYAVLSLYPSETYARARLARDGRSARLIFVEPTARDICTQGSARHGTAPEAGAADSLLVASL